MPFPTRLLVLPIVAALLANSQTNPSANGGGQHRAAFRDGVALVAFLSDATPEQRAKALTDAGAVEIRVIGQGAHVVRVPAGHVMQAMESLKNTGVVRYAEPDFQQSVSGVPNDPNFSRQWALLNTGQTVNGVAGTRGADEGALGAWSITTGSASVVVAVVDTGIEYNHPDLAPNVWSNPGGINGCAAGTHGYNVLNATCDPMDDDTSFSGHGTHVAGIIGAATNNGMGVAGVNWQTSLLGVKWVAADGFGFTSDLISALDWVIQAKKTGVNIRIVNDSQTWPGTATSQALSDEIDALGANDILFVTAAGNTAQNNDAVPRYPCVYDRPNQICAAASNQKDGLWSSSNFGHQTVDLAAPGVNIFSTLRNGTYGFISGTSMAAAEVSGAAALVLSTGYQSVTNLRATLLSAVDPFSAFATTTRTGGRLNICRAIAGCGAGAPVNTAPPVISGTPRVGQTLTTTGGAWLGSPTSFAYQWQRCDVSRANCSAIGSAATTSYTLAAADVGSTIRSAVTAANAAGSATAASGATGVVQANFGIALVQQASVQGTGVGSLSLSFPGSNTAGNLIVAVVRASTTSQTVTVTDQLGNRYVDAVAQAQATDGHQIHIFYSANISAGANTVTAKFSATNNHPWLAVFEYSGLSTAFPLDRTAGAQGNTTAVSSGATPQTRSATQLVFGAMGLPASSQVIWTAGTGYAIEQQDTTTVGSRAATEDGIASSPGAFAATYTLNGSTNWSAAVATFSTTPITAPLTITTTSLPNGTVNTAYSATLSATGGVPPYTWTESGALPPGLALGSNGAISGTPTAPGTSSFVAQVTDAVSTSATQSLSITVTSPPPTITTTSLPNGTVNTAYSATLTATGGVPPYTWTESGALPPGLALGSNGAISGTPTTSGTSNFVAQVTDAASASATQSLSITISTITGTPISLVQSTSSFATGAPSISQAFANANTQGNLIIAFIRMSTTTQSVTVTDSAGNSYTQAIAQGQSTDGHQIHIFYAKNINGGANTVTATFSATNNHPWIAIYEFSGLSTTAPLDQVAAAQGSNSTANTGLTPATTAANELVFAGLGLPASSSVTMSAGSGFALLQQDTATSTSRATNEDRVVNATGQYAGTFTLSGSSNWSAVVATFKQ